MTRAAEDKSPIMMEFAGRGRSRLRYRWSAVTGTLIWAGALIACQPTVQVAPPKEPITINLNIKLDADVRVRLEQSAKEDIQRNPGIF